MPLNLKNSCIITSTGIQLDEFRFKLFNKTEMLIRKYIIKCTTFYTDSTTGDILEKMKKKNLLERHWWTNKKRYELFLNYFLIWNLALNFDIRRFDCTYHTSDQAATRDNISRHLNPIIVKTITTWNHAFFIKTGYDQLVFVYEVNLGVIEISKLTSLQFSISSHHTFDKGLQSTISG